MTTTKTAQDNRVHATLTVEMKAQVKALASELGKKDSEVVATAIAFYLQHRNNPALSTSTPQNDEPLSNQPQKWFLTTKPENKEEIKEALNIQGEDIELTEVELFEKASELSNTPVEEIKRQGGQLLAQKLITQNAKADKTNKSGNGQGVAGGADSRLDEAYKQLKEAVANGSYKPKGGRIPLTAVSNRGMANYNSAKAWAARRGHNELLN